MPTGKRSEKRMEMDRLDGLEVDVEGEGKVQDEISGTTQLCSPLHIRETIREEGCVMGKRDHVHHV